MKIIGRFFWVWALCGLLAGCRSERLAFRLPPAPSVSAAPITARPAAPAAVAPAVLAGTSSPALLLPAASAEATRRSGSAVSHSVFALPQALPPLGQRRAAVAARLRALRVVQRQLPVRPTAAQNRDGLLLAAKIVGALLAVVGLVALLATASASTLATVGLILAVAGALIGVVLAFGSL